MTSGNREESTTILGADIDQILSTGRRALQSGKATHDCARVCAAVPHRCADHAKIGAAGARGETDSALLTSCSSAQAHVDVLVRKAIVAGQLCEPLVDAAPDGLLDVVPQLCGHGNR